MKKIIIYFTLLSVAVLFQACDDEAFLSDVDIRSIDANNDWQAVEDLESLVNGAYWHTSGNIWNDSQLDHGRINRVAQSDIARFLPNAGAGWEISSGAIQDYYNRVSDNPENAINKKIWISCYKAISSANEGIYFIENNERFDDPNGWYPRIIGELHFIRAFNYYLLAKTFAPAYDAANASSDIAFPLRISPTQNLEQANLEPSTVQQVYDLIEEDLRIAVDNLPNSFEAASSPPQSYADGRADKFAAAFLMSRVMFQTQQWDQALTHADMVINQSGHDLENEPIEAWNKVTEADPISNEVVWFYQFYAGDGVGLTSNWKYHRGFDVISATRDQGGVSTDRNIALSDYFLTQVEWIDPGTLEETAEALEDKRYLQLYRRYEASGADQNPEPEFSLDRPHVWVNKYHRGEENPQNTSIPLFRLQEMYLTRAIINFLGGNGASANQAAALEDVNAVRNKAGLNDLPTISEEDIHKERMKELAFEGDWLPYLQALKYDIGPGDRQGVSPIPYNDPSLVQTVPSTETNFNNAYQ